MRLRFSMMGPREQSNLTKLEFIVDIIRTKQFDDDDV